MAFQSFFFKPDCGLTGQIARALNHIPRRNPWSSQREKAEHILVPNSCCGVKVLQMIPTRIVSLDLNKALSHRQDFMLLLFFTCSTNNLGGFGSGLVM